MNIDDLVRRKRLRDAGTPLRVSTRQAVRIALWVGIVWLLTERPAWAYLDPGPGSMLLQMILGGIAAFVFMLKIYWKKLVARFRPKKDSLEPKRSRTS